MVTYRSKYAEPEHSFSHAYQKRMYDLRLVETKNDDLNACGSSQHGHNPPAKVSCDFLFIINERRKLSRGFGMPGQEIYVNNKLRYYRKDR
jgi:hypothetical protein